MGKPKPQTKSRAAAKTVGILVVMKAQEVRLAAVGTAPVMLPFSRFRRRLPPPPNLTRLDRLEIGLRAALAMTRRQIVRLMASRPGWAANVILSMPSSNKSSKKQQARTVTVLPSIVDPGGLESPSTLQGERERSHHFSSPASFSQSLLGCPSVRSTY